MTVGEFLIKWALVVALPVVVVSLLLSAGFNLTNVFAHFAIGLLWGMIGTALIM